MTIAVQAHRGLSDEYPENTLLAYREAVKAGADGIEMDIHRTADRVFVMMHDLSVDRTTNGSGTIDRLSYAADMRGLDAGSWKEPRFGGRDDTRIPVLEQVLDEFKGSGVTLLLHMKQLPPADCLDLLHIIGHRGMLDEVVFFGRPAAINAVRRAQPRAFTQNDGAPGPAEFEAFLMNAVEYGHPAVSVSAADVTEEMVERVKVHGKLVHASFLTADYETGIRRLTALGADSVLGNDARRMVKAVAGLNGREGG